MPRRHAWREAGAVVELAALGGNDPVFAALARQPAAQRELGGPSRRGAHPVAVGGRGIEEIATERSVGRENIGHALVVQHGTELVGAQAQLARCHVGAGEGQSLHGVFALSMAK